jgi:hypothetical protein
VKRGQNVPLSYNCANILAQLIDFLIRRCHVSLLFILQIGSAIPIQDMNTSAPTYWR